MKNVLKIAAIAALVISTSAFAGDYNEGGNGGASSTSASTSDSGAEAGAANGTNYQGNTTINQTSTAPKQRLFVPDAIAPGLTTTLTETCMGSSSGGLSVSGFGVAGGTTWTDEACVRRLDARQLAAVGAKGAALERMCEDPKNRAAILRASQQFPGNFVCYEDTPEGKVAVTDSETREMNVDSSSDDRNGSAFDLADF